MSSPQPVSVIDAISNQHNRLAAIGQQHLLTFAPQLPTTQASSLLEQLESLDVDSLPTLIETYVRSKPASAAGTKIEPLNAYGLDNTAGGNAWSRDEYERRGIDLIAAGKVAAFTVAGGQGSRLGFEGPKGCFPGGGVSRQPLFACLSDWIKAAQTRYAKPGVTIPWYIMTSPLNHEATERFFAEHNYFGLRQADVMFFRQGVMPSFDMATGKILLSQPHEVALNPDGHGGPLNALHRSGAIADMRRRGIEQICYCQIDNPLVRVIDPVFLGLHASAPDSSGEMSSKMVRKSHAGEKVGVLCIVDGKTAVVEYSDMPAELTSAKLPDDSLKFDAGSIAVHIISVEFVERLNTAHGGFSLPYHRAEKKVAHIDPQSGQTVEPKANNAVKLETFVFDALPLCKSSIVMETDRVEEFAPIKNASGPGVSDSPETCTQLQTLRAVRWLAVAGIDVPRHSDGTPNCTLELTPHAAIYPKHVAEPGVKAKLPAAIQPGAQHVI